MTFSPDYAAKSTQPLRHSWEGVVNVDQFRWFVRGDMQDQLRLAHRELHARHVRAVGIFDDELRVLGSDPAAFRKPKRDPRPNFQLTDYVIDTLLDLGIRPMFTTCFTPGVMASGTQTVFATKGRVNLPKDMGEWSNLVTTAVRHVTERYGRDEVRQWYFEVWNEPNLSGFFAGDQQDFFNLWKATTAAIKAVDSAYRVGGPSTARAEWIADLIDFGRKNDCVPDYLIAHIYNNDSESKPLSPFDGPQSDKTSKSPHFASGVVRGTRRLLDEIGFKGELHFNEWGRSWFPCDPMRETEAEAAFVVKTMAEVSNLADRFAYWNLSDIYDQVGYGHEAFHGGYGLLNLRGLRKAPYHAFELLSMLGTQRVPVAVEGGNALLTGAIATPDASAVMIYQYRHDPEPGSHTRQKVRLWLPAGADRTRLYRVGHDENNILRIWEAMDRPDYPTRQQLKELHRVNGLQSAPEGAIHIEGKDGQLIAEFDLPDPGVALVSWK